MEFHLWCHNNPAKVVKMVEGVLEALGLTRMMMMLVHLVHNLVLVEPCGTLPLTLFLSPLVSPVAGCDLFHRSSASYLPIRVLS